MTLLEFTQGVIEGRIQVTVPPIPVYDSKRCTSNKFCCGAQHHAHWICTLERNHEGPHIAYTSANRICATWAQ